MAKLPHLAWPYRLGQTVEQGTFEQLQADAAVALCTPRGQREDVPTYGVTLPIFEQVPVDIAILTSELAESGVTATVDDVTDLVDATAARLIIDPTAG